MLNAQAKQTLLMMININAPLGGGGHHRLVIDKAGEQHPLSRRGQGILMIICESSFLHYKHHHITSRQLLTYQEVIVTNE